MGTAGSGLALLYLCTTLNVLTMKFFIFFSIGLLLVTTGRAQFFKNLTDNLKQTLQNRANGKSNQTTNKLLDKVDSATTVGGGHKGGNGDRRGWGERDRRDGKRWASVRARYDRNGPGAWRICQDSSGESERYESSGSIVEIAGEDGRGRRGVGGGFGQSNQEFYDGERGERCDVPNSNDHYKSTGKYTRHQFHLADQ